MLNWLYNIVLHVFNGLLFAAMPFNLRAKKWINGRRGLFKRIRSQLQDKEKRIWIHAASLGEFEQGRPIIEEIKQKLPGLKIVLTFFSPSGYEIRKDYEFADYVFYLPLDTQHNAKKFINLVEPEFAIFIKYEFWRNFLYLLKKKQVPVYLVSAIFRKNQAFFRFWGRWYRQILKSFSWFFVQNQESIDLLKQLGYSNASISGDTRFDRVFEIASQAKEIPVVEQFVNEKYPIILGSSWKDDEEILFDYINSCNDDIKFIIAPHEIHEPNIQRIISNLKISYQRFSQANSETLAGAKTLIIDNIGMLSSIYRYGKIAYIGGGFGSGIHNILEASTFGLPVLFGPNYKKYQEAVDMVELGGAFEVNNQDEARQILDKLYKDKAFYDQSAAVSRKYVEDNRGACKTIMDYLIMKHREYKKS